MMKRLALATLLFAAPVAARQESHGLAVHEWGTFTSVAGPDGSSIQWRALAGPTDLPCFVRMLPGDVKFAPGDDGLPGMTAAVRMETPVLYFYSPRETTVDVAVRFPQGLITEWYPPANVQPAFRPFDSTSLSSAIAWNQVKVTPGAKADFPTEPGTSHYYAARETDATPLQTAGLPEKFLFYRGLANFAVPLSARVSEAGKILVTNTSRFDIGHIVLFENRGGRMGYRVAPATTGATVTLDPPDLTSNIDVLRWDLERMLTEQGLYPREAKAMVATWRDSWFEEGTRVFYLLPQAAVDAVLPLEISPKPAEVARAFVGRVEILTPAVLDDAEQAFVKGDLATLNKYGRFLEPMSWRLLAKASPRVNPTQVNVLLRRIAASHVPEQPCK